jgi:hypothetical protein
MNEQNITVEVALSRVISSVSESSIVPCQSKDDYERACNLQRLLQADQENVKSAHAKLHRVVIEETGCQCPVFNTTNSLRPEVYVAKTNKNKFFCHWVSLIAANVKPLCYYDTCSHRCNNRYCDNPKHLCWEPFWYNITRNMCFVFGKTCTHDPKCLPAPNLDMVRTKVNDAYSSFDEGQKSSHCSGRITLPPGVNEADRNKYYEAFRAASDDWKLKNPTSKQTFRKSPARKLFDEDYLRKLRKSDGSI